MAVEKALKATGAELTDKQQWATGKGVHYFLGIAPGMLYGVLRHQVKGLDAGRGSQTAEGFSSPGKAKKKAPGEQPGAFSRIHRLLLLLLVLLILKLLHLRHVHRGFAGVAHIAP